MHLPCGEPLTWLGGQGSAWSRDQVWQRTLSRGTARLIVLSGTGLAWLSPQEAAATISGRLPMNGVVPTSKPANDAPEQPRTRPESAWQVASAHLSLSNG